MRVLFLLMLLTGCAGVPVLEDKPVDCSSPQPRAITALVEQTYEQASYLCGGDVCGCIVPVGKKLILITTKGSYECLKHEVEHAICGDKHVGD